MSSRFYLGLGLGCRVYFDEREHDVGADLVHSLGFMLYVSWFMVDDFLFRVQGSGFRV